MSVASADVKKLIGRSPDRLSLEEHAAFTGKFIAMEVYSPATLPMRRIEAAGDSVDACVRQLNERGLDPRHFEFLLITPSYPV